MTAWVALIVYCYVLIWDVFCIGGCAWLVFYEGHSGWWFVLAVALACSGTEGAKSLKKKGGT